MESRMKGKINKPIKAAPRVFGRRRVLGLIALAECLRAQESQGGRWMANTGFRGLL